MPDNGMFIERRATELDERKAWANITVNYPDGQTIQMECSMIKALVTKRTDPTTVYALAAGVVYKETEEAMIEALPELFPELKLFRIAKGAENGTDTDTESK